MILVHIDGVSGDVKISGYGEGGKNHQKTGWFVAENFGFGVEREMKESGEKAGTEDMNIGVAQLNECTVSKTVDRASPLLAQYAINGNSLGTAIIDFVEVAGGGKSGKPLCYLRYKLHRCFIKSWQMTGDTDQRPTEEIAFYYNKIAFEYMYTPNGVDFKSAGVMKWDNVTNQPWEEHGLNLQSEIL
jgi:type VI secretion system secreted protein Hcp